MMRFYVQSSRTLRVTSTDKSIHSFIAHKEERYRAGAGVTADRRTDRKDLDLSLVFFLETCDLLLIIALVFGGHTIIVVKGGVGMIGKADMGHSLFKSEEDKLLGGAFSVAEGCMYVKISVCHAFILIK